MVHVFNIHLVRCYLSSGVLIQGWKRKSKDEKMRQRKRESHCHKAVMRCWFMVCDMQARPHRGLCPLPCSCHLPSGPPPPFPADLLQLSLQAHPKTRLLFILPKFSHVSPILLSFPWLDSELWCWCTWLQRDPPSQISRKHSRYTCQSML